MKRPLPGTFIPCLRLTLLGLALAQPGLRADEYWLQIMGLTPYELDLDLDNDGFTTRAEYYFGTDPFFDSSHPPSLLIGTATGLPVLTWTSVAGATYAITRSDSLDAPGWSPLGPTYTGNGGDFSLPLAGTATTQFFRVEALVPPDTDGDGLSAIEEAMLGTNPGLADTDGDTLSDFREVRETFTNPLVANGTGGTIAGTILTDPNGDGLTADGLPMAGVVVYLDTNFNGALEVDEPRFVTGANGQYAFTYLQPGAYSVRQVLSPGQVQTLPSPGVSPVLDGLPDEVVNYTHAAGGNLPVPYGAEPDASAVVPYVISRPWPNRWIPPWC